MSLNPDATNVPISWGGCSPCWRPSKPLPTLASTPPSATNDSAGVGYPAAVFPRPAQSGSEASEKAERRQPRSLHRL